MNSQTIEVSEPPKAQPSGSNTPFKLTDDQDRALKAVSSFLLRDDEQFLLLYGYAGCGKSTLVKHFLERLDNTQKTLKLVKPEYESMEVHLTALTHKAVHNLKGIAKQEATTLHSFLNITMNFDRALGKYVPRENTGVLVERSIIVVDEVSLINDFVLTHLISRTKNCKVILVGDPAQLNWSLDGVAPVFKQNFRSVGLKTIVRQAEGSPIIEAATACREAIGTKSLPNLGKFLKSPEVLAVGDDEFERMVRKEFTRPDWGYEDSKLLAWTNQTVNHFNREVRKTVKGSPDHKKGDLVVSNSHIRFKKTNIKTDQLVTITDISTSEDILHGVSGRMFELDNATDVFVPNNHSDVIKAKNHFHSELDSNPYAIDILKEIESEWADLRCAYSCTINKSQGSTFDKVFIHLNDLRRCRDKDQINRLLYVAISRARSQVVFVGDSG